MINPFKNLLSGIPGFSSDGGSSAIGIDIGSSAIKIVEIKKKSGKATLETYGSIALGPYADFDAGKVTNLPVAKIGEALREVLKQAGVTNTSGAFSIPVQSSLIFSIELPPQIQENEIGSVIATESRKYIPVPISEVSLDYFTLPPKEASFEDLNKVMDPNTKQAPGEKTNVLVVATQNDAIAKYRAVVSEASLSASFFEIEIFSSIRSNFEHELSPVLLMDFGASRTKLSIVEFGMVRSYHTIDRGGSDITESISKSMGIVFSEAERMKKEFGFFDNNSNKVLGDIIKIHIDYIFSEANNVLLSYERKNDRVISKIIFTGGGSLLKGLVELAKENFKGDVEIGHPFSKVNAPAFLDKVLDNMGPEFAVALGLALRKLQ